jgi:hydroxyacylglutathione hydrolase
VRVRQIPILSDNYAHLLIDEAQGVAAAIDPADPGPVLAAIAEEGVRLSHVLCTHHHWDHSGGNLAVLERWPEATVVGSAADADRIPGIGHRIADGGEVRVGTLTGRALAVPCHTRGHVAYLFGDALFSGDTLFVAGCGRFFEGDAAQMDHALSGVFGALPGDTRVYCGHEYTVSNLRFALSVEPDNAAVRTKLAWAEAQRAAGESTVPSTIAQEHLTNPFMRVREASVQAAMGASDPVQVMHLLREAKNAFAG